MIHRAPIPKTFPLLALWLLSQTTGTTVAQEPVDVIIGAVEFPGRSWVPHQKLLEASGLEPGDEVLVSALTFIAPANAIRYAGAWPVFIDAEPSYWQMDPQ